MKKFIMRDSDEAARLKTVTGWVSSNGHFYGDDEHNARYDGCTHKKCDCGEIIGREYALCRVCVETKRKQKYADKEFKHWDGEPLYSDSHQEFFFDPDAINDYCVENDLSTVDLDLIICEPEYLRQVEEDYWQEELPDEVSFQDVVSQEIWDALVKLNELIEAHKKPSAWHPGKYRTEVPAEATTP